jgi:ATP-dependent Lon protease
MAFSGEITLRGAILPVGGLREKLLAAQRYHIKTVFLPAGNRHERRELPASVLKNLELVWVRTVSDVFRRVIPKPKPGRARKAAKRPGRKAATRPVSKAAPRSGVRPGRPSPRTSR